MCTCVFKGVLLVAETWSRGRCTKTLCCSEHRCCFVHPTCSARVAGAGVVCLQNRCRVFEIGIHFEVARCDVVHHPDGLYTVSDVHQVGRKNESIVYLHNTSQVLISVLIALRRRLKVALGIVLANPQISNPLMYLISSKWHGWKEWMRTTFNANAAVRDYTML